MYLVLDKDTIEMEIVSYIPKTKRGLPPSVLLAEFISATFYKLKTGVYRMFGRTHLGKTFTKTW